MKSSDKMISFADEKICSSVYPLWIETKKQNKINQQ